MRLRLQEKYRTSVRTELQNKFAYKSSMQIPRIEKIVINMGVGDAVANSKVLDDAVEELTIISGQKPVITTAKKSIANFKLRENQKIGAKVTLRGEKMYEFMDRLVSIALPRVRDFNGLSTKSFDGRGNYSFGIKEQIIFPEVVYDKIEKIRGFDVIFVTSAKTNEEARILLQKLGLPFAK